MAVAADPIRKPDLSRNMALAGKTVSVRGRNVTYNERGYVVETSDYGNKYFEGTMRSVRAPSIEAVLSGGDRGGYTGPAEDLAHFSDRELETVAGLQRQVADGTLSAERANEYIEEIRRLYGYSGGAGGNEFIALQYDKKVGEVAAAEEAARAVAPPSFTHADMASSVQAVSAQNDPAPKADAQGADTAGGAERLREEFQRTLRVQQGQQSVRDALRDADYLKGLGEQKRDELFDALFEDEDDKDR